MLTNFHKIKLSRLKLSEKHLIKFDFIEKDPNFYDMNCPDKNLNIIIQSRTCISFSKFQILSFGIWLELLGFQRFLSFCLGNQNFYLKTTIRKDKIFTLLELCLNSIFLNKLNNFVFTQNYLNRNLYFFLSITTINYLNLILNNPFSLIFLNYFKQPFLLNCTR